MNNAVRPAAPLDLLGAWTALVGDSEEAKDSWTHLMGRWSEPHRTYHALTHLAAVLSIVDIHADLAADPDAVRLAAWYHDAVYDPTKPDNEERSAELAEQELAKLEVPEGRVANVARLVRLTATHDVQDGDPDGALLCDADLTVLASPLDAYVFYANAVRQEYSHVDDDTFRAGRAVILRRLLDRPRLFHTEPIRTALEEAARRNVAAELTLLEAPKDPT